MSLQDIKLQDHSELKNSSEVADTIKVFKRDNGSEVKRLLENHGTHVKAELTKYYHSHHL